MLSAYICTVLPTHHYRSAAIALFIKTQKPKTKNRKNSIQKTENYKNASNKNVQGCQSTSTKSKEKVEQ